MAKTIAYLTSCYARAGDTFIRREVEELRRRGWTVHTFSVRRAAGEGVSEEILREQRTTSYILEQRPWTLLAAWARMSARAPRRMLRAIRQAQAIRWPGVRSSLLHAIYLLEASSLAEQLVDRDVEILHDHISMNSATVAMLASTLSGVPFSMTIHGPHDFMAAEHWGLGAKVAASRATVCISEFGRSQCMLYAAREQWHKLHVVRCGLDGAFLDGPVEGVPDCPRLVSIGRLSPEKGQILLVHAAARLRDLGVAAEIVLVGDGPSRSAIEATARQLGVEDRVHLAGWQGSEDVRRLISRSRALVLPSFAEGIPVVLMEAMALRRPVIATYVGGVPELVRPGENGWLVPAGSVEGLVSAMREALCTATKDLDRMGKRGRDRVLQNHELSAAARQLEGILERAIGSKTTPRAGRRSSGRSGRGNAAHRSSS
jgi:colanic acid/amylovoran biosynthesis glycosyltransferase